MTSRLGGVSRSPFDSFNLGDHVNDVPEDVAANRRRLGSLLGVHPVYLKQVHGVDVARLDASSPDGQVADACVSTELGIACTIMVADCLPVLLTDRGGTVVAAAHAGWRGLASGVLESTVDAMQRELAHLNPNGAQEPLLAWLGPCIGPACFEVGGEVEDAFVQSLGPAAAEAFQATESVGKYWCDLPKLARMRLARCGVSSVWGNDGSAQWCTVTQSMLFFSHRRDAARLGSTGRLAACIWLA